MRCSKAKSRDVTVAKQAANPVKSGPFLVFHTTNRNGIVDRVLKGPGRNPVLATPLLA